MLVKSRPCLDTKQATCDIGAETYPERKRCDNVTIISADNAIILRYTGTVLKIRATATLYVERQAQD
jgi:hypothetical protein